MKNRGHYSAQPVPGAKVVMRAAFAGTDTFIKRAADSTRTPGERVVAGLASPVAVLGLMAGTMGLAFFGLGRLPAEDYFASSSYAAKKQVRNQVHAIHTHVRNLDADLKASFKKGKPRANLLYDLPELAKALDRSAELLGCTAAERLGVAHLTEVPRKFLRKVESVPADVTV